MVRRETIARAIDMIIAQLDPEQVFVIGSYASGTAKASSDLDLLIVAASTESKLRRDQRVQQLLAPLMIPVDINVYTPAEFAAECADPFGFARTATELQGKLAYRRARGDSSEIRRRWDELEARRGG